MLKLPVLGPQLSDFRWNKLDSRHVPDHYRGLGKFQGKVPEMVPEMDLGIGLVLENDLVLEIVLVLESAQALGSAQIPGILLP